MLKSYVGATALRKDAAVLRSEIGPLTPRNPSFLCLFSALPLLFSSIIIFPFATSTKRPHTSSTLYDLINPAHGSAFFSLQPFLHTSISFFHFHCFLLFLFHLALHFSTFHFIPISLCMLVCLFVCVAVGCLWLFFRQQPRRLDCHNLWSWVISVSNPNLGTGLFFLSSFSPPPPHLSFSLPQFCPSCPIISHSFSHFLSLFISIHFLCHCNSNTCSWSPLKNA